MCATTEFINSRISDRLSWSASVCKNMTKLGSKYSTILQVFSCYKSLKWEKVRINTNCTHTLWCVSADLALCSWRGVALVPRGKWEGWGEQISQPQTTPRSGSSCFQRGASKWAEAASQRGSLGRRLSQAVYTKFSTGPSTTNAHTHNHRNTNEGTFEWSFFPLNFKRLDRKTEREKCTSLSQCRKVNCP